MEKITSVILKTARNGWIVLGTKDDNQQEVLMVVGSVNGIARARQIASKYAFHYGLDSFTEN